MKDKIYNSDDLYLVKKYVILRQTAVFYKYSIVEYRKTGDECIDVEDERINKFNETKIGLTYIDKKTMIWLGEIFEHKKITKQSVIEVLNEFRKKMEQQDVTARTIASKLTDKIKSGLLEGEIRKMTKKISEEQFKTKNIERTRTK